MNSRKCPKCKKESAPSRIVCRFCKTPFETTEPVEPVEKITNEKGLTRCKDCDGLISRRVKTCPHCGRERLTVGRLLGYGALLWVVCYIILVSFDFRTLLSFDSKTGADKVENKATESELKQAAFCEAISRYDSMYSTESRKNFYIDQEAKVANIYAARIKKIKSILGNGEIKRWNGSIEKLGVLEDRGAYLTIKLPCSTPTTLEQASIVDINSPLYQDLRRYSVTSNITFSGRFIPPPNKAANKIRPHYAYYAEQSLTESGGVREPEFIFEFTAFHKD